MSKNYKTKIDEGKEFLKTNEITRKNKANKKFKSAKKNIDTLIDYQKELLKQIPNHDLRKNEINKLNQLKRNKKTLNQLIGETDNSIISKLYRSLNYIFNPIVLDYRLTIIKLIFLSFLIGFTIFNIFNSTNSGVYGVILLYIILYLFFIHAMNIKLSCGQNTSLLEIFNFKSLKHSIINLYFNSITNNIKDYTDSIKGYSCFEYDSKTFTRNNVSKINNLNTNFNKTLSKGTKLLNSNYPNNVPSKKYIFLTVYLILVTYLLISSFYDEKKKDINKKDSDKEKIINSIILCMVFFIWTCVLNLPTWILIMIIIAAIIVYLTYGSFSIYNSFDLGNIDSQLLCKPYIIPFVNESWAGITFDKNIKNCINNKSNSMFLTMMKPYLDIINSLQKQIIEQNSKLNNLGDVVNMFKDKVEKMIQPIYNKIKQIIDKVIKIKNKIYEIIANIIMMFKAIIYSSVNMLHSINSIDNIICGLPFIDSTSHCCFDSNTPIKIINNDNILNKKICEIKIGDILINDSKVIGVIKGKYENQQMYLYNNIIVTGNHFVYDNGKHKLIQDCKNSIPITHYKEKYVYCLITSTQTIMINNILFSDYFDINDNNIQYNIQKNIISRLNNFDSNIKFNNNLPLWCFDKLTFITMKDNSKKCIKDLTIGEETYYGKINSVIKIKINKDNIYKIKNIITTGDQIINSDGVWMRVSDNYKSQKIDVDDNIFYHIGVDNNKLLINNQLFTDFEQYNNYGYLELRDLSLP